MKIRNYILGGLAGIALAGSANAKEISNFKHQSEISDIVKHAKRVGVESELLMAVRSAENGQEGIAYGIIPQGKTKIKYDNDKGYTLSGQFHSYTDQKEKQLCWSAWTLKRMVGEFDSLSKAEKTKYIDAIDYIGDKYCPVGVKNDPKGLNHNWESNVRKFYNQFKGK